MGCKLGFSHQGINIAINLRVCENRVLGRILALMREEAIQCWQKNFIKRSSIICDPRQTSLLAWSSSSTFRCRGSHEGSPCRSVHSLFPGLSDIITMTKITSDYMSGKCSMYGREKTNIFGWKTIRKETTYNT
jgi:hypothetical protein